MALNVKGLLDPKFYYQKLRELATKENFSKIGSDIGKIFTSAGDQIRGSDIAVKDFASQIVLAGGAFELIKKGAETAFRFIDMEMQNAKARFLDFFNSIGDAANTYAAYEKQQQQLSSDNTSALEKLAFLQLSGPKLNHIQQEEQRQALAPSAHYKEQINPLSEQIRIQPLLTHGMDEAAQRQQILNELKRKGLS